APSALASRVRGWAGAGVVGSRPQYAGVRSIEPSVCLEPPAEQEPSMASIPFDHFDVLTFDCYGTLIDWEAGLLAGLRAILDPRGVAADDEDLLARYAGHESAIECGPHP